MVSTPIEVATIIHTQRCIFTELQKNPSPEISNLEATSSDPLPGQMVWQDIYHAIREAEAHWDIPAGMIRNAVNNVNNMEGLLKVVDNIRTWATDVEDKNQQLEQILEQLNITLVRSARAVISETSSFLHLSRTGHEQCEARWQEVITLYADAIVAPKSPASSDSSVSSSSCTDSDGEEPDLQNAD
jgi:hypothetical protein